MRKTRVVGKMPIADNLHPNAFNNLKIHTPVHRLLKETSIYLFELNRSCLKRPACLPSQFLISNNLSVVNNNLYLLCNLIKNYINW